MSRNKKQPAPKQQPVVNPQPAHKQVSATQKQEKQPGLLNKYWMWLMPLLSVLFIALMSFFFLYQKNSDVFFMAQLHSLFNDTPEFFHDNMKTPGGLLQWLGLWFTQLFYNPGTGITVLTLLWIIAFFLLQKAFRVPIVAAPLLLVPVTALLVSEIDLGYWIYIMKIQGYYFRDTLGVISLALLVWLSRTDKWSVAGCVVAALAYPLIGYYAPLALACILLADFMSHRVIGAALALVLGLASPFLWQNLYNTMRSDQWYTVGFPVFEQGNFVDWAPSMPFIVLAISLLALALLSGYEKFTKFTATGKKVYIPVAVGVVCLAACGFATNKYQYDNENFRAECRAYADAENQQWEDLLTTVAGVQEKVTRELIVLKNIALFETNDIGNSMYHYDDFGVKPAMPDSLKMPMSDIASPLILLYHGKTYFAYRWAMENVVEFGFNITELKIMTIASLINGEPKLAAKYLDVLSHTMYYKEWADRYRPCLKDPKKIRKYPELKHIFALYDYMGDMIDNDMGLTEKYLMNYFSHSICVDNLYVQELCMAYAMMSKDIQTFWRQFSVYAHFHRTIPIHYQEAAYLYGHLEPQSMDISHMPFDKQKIVDRYAAFNQRTQQLVQMRMTEQQIGDETYGEFGDTFWWAYYFNRGSQYY